MTGNSRGPPATDGGIILDDATPSATVSVHAREENATRQGGRGEEGRGGERRRKKGRGEQESEKAGEEKEGGSLDPHPMRKEQEQRGKGYGAGAPIPPLPLQAAKSRIEQSRVGWSRVE